jgi:cbb3-type cytochrome oxidase cytochrome c subunit
MITFIDEDCPFCASNLIKPYPGDRADRYCEACTRTWDSSHWFETHERAPAAMRQSADWFSPQLRLGLE